MAKSDQPNHDLISMVQQARMRFDAGAQPSQIYGAYWIEAKRRAEGPGPTPHAGQWVLVTTIEYVDALWERIRVATEEGKLGYKSKVSTASHAHRGGIDRVIYVRTYDAGDAADVERVRAALTELGVQGDMVYKEDQAISEL